MFSNTCAMTLAQKSDRILAQTRGLSGATPNATQLIEELRCALEENRREVERLTTERDEARREVCELLCNQPADEIERLRARVAELERFASELDASGRKHTEPAALRGTPSDGEASASEGYLHTGASVQTEKAN